MPSLLVQKKRQPSRARKAASRVEYVVPSSPFQKLVHTAMVRRGISGRQLAATMTDLGAKTSQSNLWTWLHHPNGHPHPRSFKSSHALALSKALGIEVGKLHDALDASRHIYARKEAVAPAQAQDVLAALEEMISAGATRYIRRERVLHLIQSLRRGASV